MFGYRIKYHPEKMVSYMTSGLPSYLADQSHKPVTHYVSERLAACIARYERIEKYSTKQVVVKLLDSDNEED